MKMINKFKINSLFNFKKIDFILIPLIAFIIAGIIVIPKIHLRGDSTIEVNYSKKYYEQGAKATFLGKDISKDIKTTNNINIKKLGEYEVKYTLNNFVIPISKTRKVKVVDKSKPTITLEGEKEVSVCPGKKYQEEGFIAIDNYDGDITKKVTRTTEDGRIIYSVLDSSKNLKKVTRKLVYKDEEKPNIQLNGLTEMNVTLGTVFTDPGYKVLDNCDGDITNNVNVSGSVNTNVEGTYTITYTVTDYAGNKTSVDRKVTVLKKIDPNSGVRKPGVIYLTFDDGPQEGTTNAILDILKEEGVKATFFVTNKGADYLIKREADEGHIIALHTASHNYATVYSSVDNYFNDLNVVGERVKRITGYESKIIRFPGGSSNTVSRKYCQGIMTTLTNEVLNRGYRYYDWNISSGDAGGTTDPNGVYNNVVNSLSHDRPNIILMHDIKTHTRDALKNIIKYGKENGYTFEPITMDTAMIRQRVNN